MINESKTPAYLPIASFIWKEKSALMIRTLFFGRTLKQTIMLLKQILIKTKGLDFMMKMKQVNIKLQMCFI
jgi:hypothetical protein